MAGELLHPRVGVSAGVWCGDRVLLVRRLGAAGHGLWSFPGGHLEWGESLADAVRREVREEAGLEIELAGAPLAHDVLLRDGAAVVRHYVLLVFAARAAADAVPVAGDDAGEARFVHPDAIADLAVTDGLHRFVAWSRSEVDRVAAPRGDMAEGAAE